MLEKITAWFLDLFKHVFSALWDFVTDIFIALVDLLLGAVVALASLIPVPPFMAQGLGSLFSALDGSILYVATSLGIPIALGIIGAGYAFRLARKVVTLFQW